MAGIRWPLLGLAFGGFLTILMLMFTAFSEMETANRSELTFEGAIFLGGTGILSAALIAGYIAPNLAKILTRRDNQKIPPKQT